MTLSHQPLALQPNGLSATLVQDRLYKEISSQLKHVLKYIDGLPIFSTTTLFREKLWIQDKGKSIMKL